MANPIRRKKLNRQQFPAGLDGQQLVLETHSPDGIAWREPKAVFDVVRAQEVSTADRSVVYGSDDGTLGFLQRKMHKLTVDSDNSDGISRVEWTGETAHTASWLGAPFNTSAANYQSLHVVEIDNISTITTGTVGVTGTVIVVADVTGFVVGRLVAIDGDIGQHALEHASFGNSGDGDGGGSCFVFRTITAINTGTKAITLDSAVYWSQASGSEVAQVADDGDLYTYKPSLDTHPVDGRTIPFSISLTDITPRSGSREFWFLASAQATTWIAFATLKAGSRATVEIVGQ